MNRRNPLDSPKIRPGQIVTDYMEQDRVMATKTFIAGLIELAKAMGQSVPSLGAHLEPGRTGVPGAAVPARGAPTRRRSPARSAKP